MKAFLITLFALFGLGITPVLAATELGQPAPDFTAVDTKGASHTLSDYKGKVVVLEWSNHECPFVVKHYSEGNMQALQKEATEQDVIWLTIVSSAEGKQGHVSAEQANSLMETAGTHSTARILDTSGEIGHMYGAKTTPHMFVIDANGALAYMGAIDSNPDFKPDSITGATNYVREAIKDLKAGVSVRTASTQPYGCGVKY